MLQAKVAMALPLQLRVLLSPTLAVAVVVQTVVPSLGVLEAVALVRGVVQLVQQELQTLAVAVVLAVMTVATV
jgi:hypothetical protein